MANWIDVLSFLIITSLFVGTIVGVVFTAKRLSAAAQNTKNSLLNKGISISDTGVSIKTSKRFDRENYVDATQRGVIKVLDASNFHPSSSEDSQHNLKSKSSSNLLSADHGATHSFGIRRSHSGASK
ncbi:hypothetical protein DEU56DRAFT_782876 [Suillus clintonianus]|uniref:uncharacterized protein n=1 Tax=Suillus clintonianus TaxID=1904413 RepID=UPI001B86E339|nr:uncharacterized protein DEU56DRAFT_782876 [Suillus clintonianus]KAG2148917.1 hypothetical protein DEU56DRAFT_782876 [Suillus clintonianus]